MESSLTGSTERKQYQDSFLEEASRCLRYSAALPNYIETLSRRWNLHHLEAQEVLLEAINRGLDYINQKGRAIENPGAWLRVVAVNIIRDEAKATAKRTKMQALIECEYYNNRALPIYESDLSDNISILRQAMEKLSKSDQEMLQYRFQNGLRYKEIQDYLLTESGKKISIPALRKRESRALKRLREMFLEINKQDKHN